MADNPISALPAAAALTGNEPVPSVQSGVTVQTTTQDIADLADLSGYLTTDGSTPGATGQQQAFTFGILADTAGTQVSIDPSGTPLSITTGANTTSFSATGVSTKNITHPANLTTPADAVIINGVKVYRALLSQAGTSAPTAIVLENTLGETPTFEYNDVGDYNLATVGELFSLDKVFIFISNPATIFTQPIKMAQAVRTDIDNINIKSFIHDSDVALGNNDILSNTEIQILIYP